jgi:hypothetical protein
MALLASCGAGMGATGRMCFHPTPIEKAVPENDGNGDRVEQLEELVRCVMFAVRLARVHASSFGKVRLY